ncbi:MAG: PAS domain-containing protein [Bacteroides sp.]
MDQTKVQQLECSQCLMELRSGRIISADEGFTKIFGYTREDIANGITYEQLVPCLDEKEIVAKLREQFVFSSNVCYEHTVMCKNGEVKAVCSMMEIQNTLLKGHRMLRVSSTEIASIIELDTEAKFK